MLCSLFQNELIIRDLPKALFFFNDMKEQVADVATSVQRLLFKVKNGEFAKSQVHIFLQW